MRATALIAGMAGGAARGEVFTTYERTESIVAIMAAMLVLFSALLSPPVSVIVALSLLIALIVCCGRHRGSRGS